MYAIVDIAGQQFKVEKNQKLFVHRLEAEEGKKVSFDKVLLIDTGSKISIGDPVVKGASVNATVLSHVKGDKVLVFKKKRRKGYQKLNGHRQYMTQIQIEAISEKGAAKPKAAESKAEPEAAPKAEAKPKAAPKTEAKPKAAPKTEAKPKAAPKAEAKPKAAPKTEATPKAAAAKKPAAAKASAEKKPAAKASTAKKPAEKKPAAKAAPKKESGDK
jgi:large subunit ribosomal protein L21